jgi:hypothetical protein
MRIYAFILHDGIDRRSSDLGAGDKRGGIWTAGMHGWSISGYKLVPVMNDGKSSKEPFRIKQGNDMNQARKQYVSRRVMGWNTPRKLKLPGLEVV